MSVVLVDDSTDVRTLVRMRLEGSGLFEVVGEAADGEHAVDLVIRHAPEVVLLDVSIPDMDGVAALPAILSVRPRTAVVMFSGFGGADLVAELRELGAVDFIEKSLPLEHLPDRLLRGLADARPDLVERLASRRSSSRPSGRAVPAAVAGVDLGRIEQVVLDEHLEGFRALFDRAAIGMATLTVDATIVRANDALATMMSCEPADLVGVDYGRLTGGLGDVLDTHLVALRSSDSNVATFEHPVPEAPGATTQRTALVTLVPIRDSSGQVLYVFAQVQDVTAQRVAREELHRAEQNFRLLVEAVEEYAIYLLDTDGTVRSWNAGARRIKGYTAQEAVGRHFRMFYPSEQRLAGHAEHNLELALRDGSYAEEGWRVRRDGTTFWASVVITAVRDERGRHIGFAKVTRDQTQHRRNADDRLEAMAEQSRLLAVTAHELRNPTVVIEGSAHALEQDGPRMTPEAHGRLFRGIRSSVDRLRRLGDDLAAASQLQGTGMHLRVADVALGELVRGVAARRSAATPDVHAEVEVEVDVVPGEEVVVRVDEVRLAQALDNLVDNAVRHGAPPFALSAQVRDDEVEVRVSDGGRGVPSELLPRMFDRFATAGPTSGTGLGLYLVREIMGAHGGDVAYEAPAEGRRTTFRVCFPRDASKR